MDNFLITCKWKGFNWTDVWSEKPASGSFNQYLHLEGRVFMTDDTALPDSTLVTFFLQKSVMTYEIYVDHTGKFDFSLLMDFMGEEEVFYRIENHGTALRNARVKINEELPFHSVVSGASKLGSRDEYAVYSEQKKRIDRSFSFHSRGRSYHQPPSLNALLEDEVFDADVVVNLGEYFRFPTMSETLKEIVPVLQHRKIRDRDMVRLFFDDRNIFADGEPLYIIDGVITDNTPYFLSLKPAEVVSIKVINSFGKLKSFGSTGKNGFVLVETKIAGNNALVPRSDYTSKILGLNEGVGIEKSFWGNKDQRTPDLRSTLYWNPEIKTDSSGNANLSFPVSDDTGNFKVLVEGFTADGFPFSVSESFRVSYSSH